MVSNAIWKKHARVSFSTTIRILKSWKNSRVFVFSNCTRNHTITMDCKIILLSMLLLINNIHEKKLCMQSLSHSYIKTPKCFFLLFLLEIAVFYWLSVLLFHI